MGAVRKVLCLVAESRLRFQDPYPLSLPEMSMCVVWEVCTAGSSSPCTALSMLSHLGYRYWDAVSARADLRVHCRCDTIAWYLFALHK